MYKMNSDGMCPVYRFGLVYGVRQYFSYFVAVSFIGG